MRAQSFNGMGIPDLLQLSVLWYCGIRRTAAEETGKAVAVFSAPMDSSEQAAAAIPVPDAKLVL